MTANVPSGFGSYIVKRWQCNSCARYITRVVNATDPGAARPIRHTTGGCNGVAEPVYLGGPD